MHSTSSDYITRSRIESDLQLLGVKEGDLLMLHASVKALGWIVGGPDVVLHSILNVIGQSGTLTMMVGWEDYPYHLPEWPIEKKEAYLEGCPPFNPEASRANHREFGILCEYLRTLPGTLRSQHPSCSFAALGPRAKEITENHPLQFGFGTNSPLEKLVKFRGKVLSLGAPLNSLTILHYAEHIADVPNKRIARYRMPILVDGQTVWKDFEEYDSSLGIVDWEGEDYFTLIGRDYLAQSNILQGQVGKAKAYLFEASELVKFGSLWMAKKFTTAP